MKPAIAFAPLLVLAGCASELPAPVCPKLSDVAPSSISSAYFSELTAALAGPDRANTITEAVAIIHGRAPGLTPDAIADILIAADCPNIAAEPDHDQALERVRVAEFLGPAQKMIGNELSK